MDKKYSVLIVEDQALPRRLLEMMVTSSPNYTLTASIDCAAMTDLYIVSRDVDLVLMDVITRDGASGLDAAEKIKRLNSRVKIIIVTSMPEHSYISRAKNIGVEGFWYKESAETEILRIMDRVMSGERVYPDAPPIIDIGNIKSSEFTARELEVLRELLEGDTDREIGEKLNLSADTVHSHIKNMLGKTGFKSRTKLAVAVRESGLIINDY